MGGFLSGLGELLGGFNAVRRIDKEGFDWREQQQAQQFERDRRVEETRQKDEDRTVGIGKDILLGSEEGQEPDISNILGPVGQATTMARIRGAVAQSRPALESMRLANQRALLETRGQQQMDLEKLKGLNRLKAIAQTADEREAIIRLQEDLLADREPNPRDRYMASQAASRAQTMGRPQLRATGGGEYAWLYPPEAGGQAGAVVSTGARVPLPAAQRESQNRGATALATISNIENLLSMKPPGEEWTGPLAKLGYEARSGTGKAGFVGDVLGMEPPSGQRALFSTAIAELGNRAVQDITGAQVGQHEVPRLFTEIPSLSDRGEVLLAKLAVTKYRLQLLDQLRSGQISREEAISQINNASPQTIFGEYQQRGLTGGGEPRPGGSRYQKVRE